MAKHKSEKLVQAGELAAFLRTRREVLLNKWRERCDADPLLSRKSSFSREEFNDQVPVLLDILDHRLKLMKPSNDPVEVSSQHGLHRWQSGYSLQELMIELEHLFAILIHEVSGFDPDYTKMDTENASHVYRELNRLYSEASRGSVLYYHELRQTAAAEQAASLQAALDQLYQMGKERNEHLRHSSHDLRSSFSVMLMASQLSQSPSSEKERSELMTIINRNLASVRDMLLQLTDYARIEAGQETLEIKQLNVSALITEVVENARPVAEMRKLTLTAEGPEKLEIMSDKVQIQRILQNLLYNALKYTEKGGIYVSWTNENDSRWVLSIQDTGPGFQEDTPTGLFVGQLKPASHTTAIHKQVPVEKPAPTVSDKNEDLKESEGLGLFIVKKICELMKATMDIESRPETGTLVRIRFQARQEPNAKA
ncbi:HAMP domain-containing histidine kinase [Dyadobacter sp. LJ53]|uniref:sensor histidine kinase n=1 Tax=Dyadobacter chenwenxiniae TaxID=2906456 RepID=UPI001F1896C3|nr:HAMP domain-containing sensor histidine kinase [Dyadobacter chenwenxiniae]MCF0050522.1 HAMP domain-containing histidine kinase [Dyadobacter chenwenxiniae]